MALTKEGGNAAPIGAVNLPGDPTAGNLIVLVGGARDSDNNVTPVPSLNAATTAAGFSTPIVTSPMEYHVAWLSWKVAEGDEGAEFFGCDYAEATVANWTAVASLQVAGISDWELDVSAVNGSGSSNVSSIASGSTGTPSAASGIIFVVGTSRTNSQGLSISGVPGLVDLTTIDSDFQIDAGNANFIADAAELTSAAAQNATVSESSGSSRMGVICAVFTEAGGGGAIEQPIGQATETDQAQALESAKSKSVNQTQEADTALGLGSSKSRNLGLAVEADVVFPLVVAKTLPLGQAAESDVAPDVEVRKARALGSTAESDAAFAIGSTKARSLGLASEADSTFALAVAKLRSLGFATETDEAFGLTQAGPAGTIGLATEADQVFALTPIKTRTLGLAAETQTTFALTTIKARTLGIALETDSAFSLTEQGAAGALGLALEADEVLPLVVVKSRGLGLVQESDAAQPLAVGKVRELGLAAETDTVFALGSAKARTLGLVAEADSAFALTVVGGTAAPTIVAVELAYTGATCTLTHGGASVELEMV